MRLFGRRVGEPSMIVRVGRSSPPDAWERVPCASCGATTWVRAGPSVAPTVCPLCAARLRPPVALPPTAAAPTRPSVAPKGPTPRQARRIRRWVARQMRRRLREAERAALAVRRSEAPTGIVVADLRRAFEDWDAAEAERLELELLDDLRVVRPDLDDAGLRKFADGFMPRRGRR